VILATGSIERPMIFDCNDRPGIMLSSAVRQYINYYGVKCGNNVVIFTNNDDAYETAISLHNKGVKIEAIVDIRSRSDGDLPKKCNELGIKILWKNTIVYTEGYKKINKGPDVKLRTIARGTPGFSGADLANLCNESALLAARKNKRIVTMSDIEEAKDKVMMGAERRSMVMTEDDKKLTAYHEGGHAIVALNEKASDPIHKATIIPRGTALGVVWTLPERDKYSHSREYLKANISKAMGGRIAEELIFGHEKVTSGASSDIQMATKLAKDMVTRFGMSTELGPQTFGENEDEVFLGRSITRHQQISEETAKKVDAEIRKIVDAGYQRAKKILTEKIDDLHKLAKALMLYETLTGDEIKDLILNNKSPKNKEDLKEEEQDKSSALGSLGLKPKPAH